MTNFSHTPAGPSTHLANTTPARRGWRTADAVASSLLTAGLGTVNLGLLFLFFIGWAMASYPCSSGQPCPSQDAANHIMMLLVSGLILSLVVALGGLLVCAWRNVVMIWAPAVGVLIAAFTVMIAFSSAG